MMTSYFHLVPQLRSEVKYFPCSRGALVRALTAKGKAEVRAEHVTLDADGTEVFADLRLNVNCTSRFPFAWSASLKLHRKRVDGVDWESHFTQYDGTAASGWQRHLWDKAREDGDSLKTVLTNFEDVASIETFLLRVCEVMRIRFDPKDHGDDLLPFDS